MAGILGATDDVVSLGMMLCIKIAECVHDYKTRDEQLGGVLRRAQLLREHLQLFDRSAREFATKQPEASHAVSASVAACEIELRELRDLVYKLAPSAAPPADIMGKMRETAKRFRFPFERVDIGKMETRLDRTSETLSRAIDCLSLCSQSRVSSELVVMHRDVRDLISRFDDFSNMLRSRDDIAAQNQADALIMALMSKPSALRTTCDAATSAAQPYETVKVVPTQTLQKQVYGKPPFSCGCRPRQSKYARMSHLGFSFSVLEETVETRAHRPSCARALPSASQTSRSKFLTYTGLVAYMSQAVSLGFTISWGAGGSSLGPVLRCRGMVEHKRAPAFVLMDRLFLAFILWSDFPALVNRVVEQSSFHLRKLYATGRASPTDVNEHGATLLTNWIYGSWRHGTSPASWSLIETLLDLEVPTQGVGESIWAWPAVFWVLDNSWRDAPGKVTHSNLVQLSTILNSSEGELMPISATLHE